MPRFSGGLGLFRPALAWLEKGLAKGAERRAGQEAAFGRTRAWLRDRLRGSRADAKPFEKRSLTDDPIDIASGEVVLRLVDAALPGVLPLVLARTHVSSYRSGELFGPSWASTLDQRIEVDASGVAYAAEDGMVLSYPLTPGVAVMPHEGPRWPLLLTSAGCTITDPRSGHVRHFAATDDGRLPLTAISDRNGNRIEFAYSDGIIAEVRHSGGYRIAVDTEDGRVTALRAPTGNGHAGGTVLIRYAYDRAGDLTATYDPADAVSRYAYDGDHRMTGWTDRNGYSYEYAYDESGRGVRGREPAGFLDATLSFQDGVTLVTDALGHVTRYVLNDLGQVVEEVDPLGGRTRSEWDRYDRLLSRTDPTGRTSAYEWDEAGNLTAVTYPGGGRLTTVYNDLNLPLRVTETDGVVWRQAYDERGNLLAVTDPLEATTRYAYNEHGHLATITDPLGNVTRVRTDAAGLPVEITDPLGGTVRATRDPLGRVTTITDPMGGVTRISWTFHDKPAARTLPGGATERWSYDAEGNLVAHTDATGAVTRYEITHFDTRSAEIRPDGSRLEFGYDRQLRLTAVTDPRGLVWRYEYDPAGNLVRETDFDGRALHYAYDAAGRLAERTNGAGQRTRFVRDAAGNVIERDTEESSAAFAYDRAGRMIRAVNAEADVRFEYDAVGRLVAESSNGRALTSEYDPLGRRVARRTPSGAEAVWRFDAASRPVLMRTAGQDLTFAYDAAGRELRRRIGTGAVLDQRWDADHRLGSQTIWGAPPAGGSARLLQHRAYAYRGDGHLVAVSDRTGGDRRYDIDPAGRVIAVTAQTWNERYAYDPAGNLTAAASPASSVSSGPPVPPGTARELAYDGTLLRRAGNVRYEHDAQGRVVLRQHARPSGKPYNWRFTWDGDDRLTGVTTPDGTRWRYGYDALGRRVVKQRLAADGHSVAEQTEFFWDDTALAEEMHTARGETGARAWHYEPGTHRPLAQTDRVPVRDAPQRWIDRRFHAIVTDLVGAPAELVDPSGDLAWRSRTTLWGRLADVSGDAGCPLRFPGQYHDAETGACYNLHRYYDPETARYQSPDPLGLSPSPNPYAYATDPTAEIDPLGLANYKRKPPAAAPRLSGRNPISRRMNAEYEKIQAMRAAERRTQQGEQNVDPFPLGRPTPRGGWQNQTTVEDRPSNRFPPRWIGAREWEVPTRDGTAGSERILEGRDGLFGYTTDHLRTVKMFPAPWYPDGGSL